MSKEYLDRKEIEEIVDEIYDAGARHEHYGRLDKITQICQLKPKNQKVIFKAKLTKGINLSKVIEQVLYPKYIGKKIIILEEE